VIQRMHEVYGMSTLRISLMKLMCQVQSFA
jgi:hypothetical protein